MTHWIKKILPALLNENSPFFSSDLIQLIEQIPENTLIQVAGLKRRWDLDNENDDSVVDIWQKSVGNFADWIADLLQANFVSYIGYT